MELTGAALVHVQSSADFAQTVVSRIAQANDGTVPFGQALDFLAKDCGPLPVLNYVVRRMFGRRGDPVFEIHLVFAGVASSRELSQRQPRIAPHRIQHFSTDTKLRVSGKGRAAARPVGPTSLQETNVTCLNQIRHLDPTTSWKTRVHSAGEQSHEPAHIFDRSRRSRILRRLYADCRSIRVMQYVCHLL